MFIRRYTRDTVSKHAPPTRDCKCRPALSAPLHNHLSPTRPFASQRPWINFHCDISTFTANVALNDDTDFEGGRLLAILDGKLQIVPRLQGEATVHDANVYHAVSAMRTGVRYTLIVFFYELKPGEDAEEYRATPLAAPSASGTSAAKLACAELSHDHSHGHEHSHTSSCGDPDCCTDRSHDHSHASSHEHSHAR